MKNGKKNEDGTIYIGDGAFGAAPRGGKISSCSLCDRINRLILLYPPVAMKQSIYLSLLEPLSVSLSLSFSPSLVC